jgi:hypothetical protein
MDDENQKVQQFLLPVKEAKVFDFCGVELNLRRSSPTVVAKQAPLHLVFVPRNPW